MFGPYEVSFGLLCTSNSRNSNEFHANPTRDFPREDEKQEHTYLLAECQFIGHFIRYCTNDSYRITYNDVIIFQAEK